jgi:hypothetical protein
MKTKIWIVAFLLLTATAMSAQKKHTTKFNATGERKVVFKMDKSNLTIETHASNEIIIESDKEYKIPEEAKGLKPLSNKAKDNTEMGLEIKKEGNKITVKKAGNQSMNYTIKLPKNTNISIENMGWWSLSEINIKDIAGEIEIKSKKCNINLQNVTGPLVVNTTSGDINIVFSTVSGNPTAISSNSGNIDVTIPESTKADFKLKTYDGEVLTDLDIEVEEDNKTRISGERIEGKLNGGGIEISIRSMTGNLYLRKK